MTRLFNYLIEAIRSPREQLSLGQQFVRKSVDLVVYCYRQLQRQRADGMAAELTYRTIFALIPVVVLGLVMFRVVGGLEDVQAKVENQLFSFFGVPDITQGYEPLIQSDATDSEARTEQQEDVPPLQTTEALSNPRQLSPPPQESAASSSNTGTTITPQNSTQSTAGKPESIASLSAAPSPNADPKVTTRSKLSTSNTESSFPETDADNDVRPEQATEADAAQQARISIRRTLHDLADKVATVDFASIGVFGLLLFTYAAVALANAAEHLFNRIYEAPSKRPAHLRLAIHWSILTLGGGLLAMSLYLSGQIVDWFGNMEGRETLKPLLTHCVSLIASWILLFLVYALMPNTRVSVRAAAIGASVSAVLWELAKYGFQIYLSEAVPYSLYGSLGLIPLFLFWIYLTWLVVLFGLILTYTLQKLGGHLPDQFEPEEPAGIDGDPDWMLPIMCEVGNSFDKGSVLDHQTLASQIGLTTRTVDELVTHLLDANLLRQVTRPDTHPGLTLARPADKIALVEILDLAQRVCPPQRHPAWTTFSGLKKAERQAALGKTLADADH